MKTSIGYIKHNHIILAILFLITAFANAQLKNDFDPRFNEAVNGDFAIIANNMLSRRATQPYNANGNNQDFDLVYVDIDGNTGIGNTTFNSSSANFKNPDTNVDCLNIKEAFLYWVASDFEPDANDPNSENQPDWNYNDIKIMLPSQTAYTDLTADEVIYRGREDNVGGPFDGHFANDPYVCFKDITSLVLDLVDNNVSPFGTYQVANVEAKLGNLIEHGLTTPTGTAGGWQIVFVYESPLLPLKNISIYDGYSHVINNSEFDVTIDGFQTSPTGNINAKVLMGALEGDRRLVQDRFQIQDVNGTFQDLTTAPFGSIRPANNFFNSRITIDNADFTDRNPASTNTLGFDAAIFNLQNPANSIIQNNQTSATFRMTSFDETYGLYVLGLSIDVFEPSLGPIQVLTDIATTPVAPGSTIGGSFNIENKGNDDAVDVTISSTLPPQLSLVEPIVGLDTSRINYTYDPASGDLVFTVIDGNADAGDPPFDVDFQLEIQDECYFLEENCNLSFGLQFQATYRGVQNPALQTTDSSSGLDDCGVGNNEETIINIIQPVVSWQTPASSLDRTVQCNNVDALNEAQNLVPEANKCDFSPVKTAGTFIPDATCPSAGSYRNTWNFVDACGETIDDFVQIITVVNTAPVVIPENGSNTVNCISDATGTFTVPSISDACGNTLTPSDAVITETPDPLTCEGTRTYTYTFTDCSNNSYEWAYVYTIDIPAFTILNDDGAQTVECISDASETFTLPTVTDACGNTLTPSDAVISETPNPLTCEGTRTYTYTYSDCASNTAEWAYVYTIELTPFELPENEIETVNSLAEAIEPTPPSITDNCENNITPLDPVVSAIPDCQGSIVYTYTYQDCAGNSAEWTYTYTIEIAPFTVPLNEDATVACISEAVVPSPPEVLDANGVAVIPVMTENANPDCEGDKVYTFTYTDCAGNSGVWIYTYTIETTIAPIVPDNAGSTVECIANATQPDVPVVTDACGNDIIPVITENDNPICEGEKIYTFTYTDCADNASVYIYTYTIETTIAPIIPDNAGSTVECIANATQPDVPVVTDACGNDITPVITENDNPICEGEKVYTFTYTDCADNESVYTYTYTIETTIAPIVPDDAGSTVECISNVTQPEAPVVTDACGNNITPLITENEDPTCEGDKVYTFTYTDCADNESVYNYTYTIDLTDFVLPANGLETIDNLADAVEPTPPTVSDNCENAITPSAPTRTDTPDCQGSIVYTFTYQDCAGNSADWTFTYTIELAPFTVPLNEASTVACISEATAPTPPDVLDANGDTVVPVMTENEDPDCEGDKEYNFTYTDCAGNSGVWIYTYTIETTIAPIVPDDAGSTVECIGNATQPEAPTVTDACGNNITPVVTQNDDPLCEGEKIYTFTYTDCADNQSVYIYTYTIDTTIAPVVPDNAGSTVECIANATQPEAPSVEDICGNDITPVITENEDPVCEGEKIYTFTYTDCAGNASVYIYTYTIDLTGFVLPTNGLETIDNLADAVEPTPPTVTDNCGNPLTPSTPTRTDTPECQGSIVYTFTYQDCAANSEDWTYTYTIELAPFAVPSNDSSTVECISEAIAPTPPDVFDANGDAIIPVMTESADPDCEGDKEYNFTYTDCAGNTGFWLYTYTIDTTINPVVPDDTGSTVECIGNATQPEAPIVTDVCGNDIIPVVTENNDPVCEGEKVYTFTYTDCAGNASVYNYTYTIDLTTAPAVPDNDGTTVECVPDATQPEAAVVTDLCGNDITPVITENEDPVCEGDKIYTFTYTDCAGNASVYTYTYTVKDTTPPVISLPENVTAQCSDDVTPIAFGEATAEDNCDPNPIITFSDERTDGTCGGSFMITRTWTATDACGNSVSANQIISTADTTPPEFDQTTLPEDVVVECNTIPAEEVLTATDDCSTAIVTVEDERIDGNCLNNYTIERSYIATDECGVKNTHIQTITVQDTTPPEFVETLPTERIVVECDAIPEPETLTATDICGSATVTVSDTRTDGNCPSNYIIARTWVATDECGLTSSYTQIITVQDTTPPTFVETLPREITVECDDVPEPDSLTAVDNCGTAIVTVNDVRTDGNCPSNYILARTWVATDQCGLTTSHTQIITVQDTTAPVPTSSFEETLDVSCTDIPEAPEVAFEDNCSSNVIVEFEEINLFDETVIEDYQIIRTWTVRDACNNEAEYIQTLNVSLDEILNEVVAEDRCFDNGFINLDDFLAEDTFGGSWEIIQGNTIATITGSIFDPTNLEEAYSEEFNPNTEGIEYILRYTGFQNGCINITDVIMVIDATCRVLPCGAKDISISTAVTPNGDGRNETFDIEGITLCGFIAEVKIFNRWGALVFETNEYVLGSEREGNAFGPLGKWDGSSTTSSLGNNGKLPNGTYYYIINLRNSGLDPLTGPIYLGTK